MTRRILRGRSRTSTLLVPRDGRPVQQMYALLLEGEDGGRSIEYEYRDVGETPRLGLWKDVT